ncbi:hypothetical protein KC19_6G058900, partial [Ceratodon purpureus]
LHLIPTWSIVVGDWKGPLFSSKGQLNDPTLQIPNCTFCLSGTSRHCPLDSNMLMTLNGKLSKSSRASFDQSLEYCVPPSVRELLIQFLHTSSHCHVLTGEGGE